MPKVYEGHLVGRGRRFAIVVSRFNELIGRQLLDGAVGALTRHGVADGDIEVFWVPGAFELPLVAKRAAASGRFAAVVCIGVVIRGATPHFDFVAGAAASGIAEAALATGVPVIFGVLTTETIEQALERAGTKAGNRGWDAALAALEMADLLAGFDR
jgi:6,7-dimethyl-8-ribityllumazine synthase